MRPGPPASSHGNVPGIPSSRHEPGIGRLVFRRRTARPCNRRPRRQIVAPSPVLHVDFSTPGASPPFLRRRVAAPGGWHLLPRCLGHLHEFMSGVDGDPRVAGVSAVWRVQNDHVRVHERTKKVDVHLIGYGAPPTRSGPAPYSPQAGKYRPNLAPDRSRCPTMAGLPSTPTRADLRADWPQPAKTLTFYQAKKCAFSLHLVSYRKLSPSQISSAIPTLSCLTHKSHRGHCGAC